MKRALVVIVIAWFILTQFELVPSLYLPHPLELVRAWRSALFWGACATIARAISGFVLGVLVAYILHFLAIVLKLENALQAQFAGGRAVPVVAALPLFVIWFGFGEFGRILIVLLTATVFFIAPLHDAYQFLGREWTILREQLGLRTSTYYWHIVIPGTLAALLGAFRVTAAISFTVAVASEYMGAQSGLGRFIDSARVTFNVPAIFLALILASTVGISVDGLVSRAHQRWVHWAGRQVKG